MKLIKAGKILDNLSGVLKSMDDYDAVKKVINDMPTAYDVDAVVEQLESESDRWQDSGDAYNDEKEKGVAIGFRKAIEIVKGGGVE